ncbi:polyamine-modulated factor 1 [Stigmatopora argus]
MEENAATTTPSENSSKKPPSDDFSVEASSSKHVKSEAACVQPRGCRLKFYHKVIERSLAKFTDFASTDRFASMFHELYKINPARMEIVNKEFVKEFQKSLKDGIDLLNKEAGIEAKLNKLDELETAAKTSPDPAWRPSGDPEEDLSSSIIPLYQKQDAYWRRKLQKIKAENATLAQKVKAGRERTAQTDRRISTALAVLLSTAEWEALSSDLESRTSSLCPADVLDV